MDIGVSSHQLDEEERGFTYRTDAPLDMRMDRSLRRTAADLVRELSQEELTRIIREYGEERWAARIAEFIVKERQKGSITTTGQLVQIIKAAVPAGARREGRIRPAAPFRLCGLPSMKNWMPYPRDWMQL